MNVKIVQKAELQTPDSIPVWNDPNYKIPSQLNGADGTLSPTAPTKLRIA
jgi:hypothetical protein